MRLHHPEASAQHFEMSVLKSGDNDEGAEEETEKGEGEEGGVGRWRWPRSGPRKMQDSAYSSHKTIVNERQSWPALGVVLPMIKK